MSEIGIDHLDTLLTDDIELIDVREAAEFAQAHVAGARLVPMGRLASVVDDLPTDRPVYLICASGNRSGAMCDLLRARGVDAVNVAGGTMAWVRSGRPFERGL